MHEKELKIDIDNLLSSIWYIDNNGIVRHHKTYQRSLEKLRDLKIKVAPLEKNLNFSETLKKCMESKFSQPNYYGGLNDFYSELLDNGVY